MHATFRYFNRSQQTRPSDVVVFHRGCVVGQPGLAVAWRVIRNCGRDWSHPFIYCAQPALALGDGRGNYSPRVAALTGSRFTVLPTPAGRTLSRERCASPTTRVQVKNALVRGAVDVNLFNAGRLIAVRKALAPGQMAEFDIGRPALWIALCDNASEGRQLDPAALNGTAAALPLAWGSATDIVLSGGGSGADATALVFRMEGSSVF